jgi:hypothetical protein
MLFTVPQHEIWHIVLDNGGLFTGADITVRIFYTQEGLQQVGVYTFAAASFAYPLKPYIPLSNMDVNYISLTANDTTWTVGNQCYINIYLSKYINNAAVIIGTLYSGKITGTMPVMLPLDDISSFESRNLLQNRIGFDAWSGSSSSSIAFSGRGMIEWHHLYFDYAMSTDVGNRYICVHDGVPATPYQGMICSIPLVANDTGQAISNPHSATDMKQSNILAFQFKPFLTHVTARLTIQLLGAKAGDTISNMFAYYRIFPGYL